jgi:hypothetical protein
MELHKISKSIPRASYIHENLDKRRGGILHLVLKECLEKRKDIMPNPKEGGKTLCLSVCVTSLPLSWISGRCLRTNLPMP